MITVPTIHISRLEDVPLQLGDGEEPIAAVLMHVMGDLTGRTLLVFPQQTALRMAQLVLHRPGKTTAFGPLEESAIKEAGNILAGAYMNALSEFMGLMLLPSPPSLTVDMSAAILTTAHLQFGSERDLVISVETQFLLGDRAEQLRGFFLLLPDLAALHAILRAIRVA
jgi:chemotaxis protein CheC